MILTNGEDFYNFDLISEHSQIKAIVKFSLFIIRIISYGRIPLFPSFMLRGFHGVLLSQLTQCITTHHNRTYSCSDILSNADKWSQVILKC